MATCPPATDAQRAAAKPGAIGYFSALIAGMLSYIALGVYVWMATRPDIKIISFWFGATWFAERAVQFICNRRLERIVPPQMASPRSIPWMTIAVGLMLLAFLTFI